MKIALLLPGLKDSQATGLLRLKPWLEVSGFRTYAVLYGYFLVRGFLWHLFNMPVARMLVFITQILSDLGHTVVCVAHSNGAAIAAKASQMGAAFHILVFVNGAVERDIKLGDRTGYLLNCRVATDPVLAVSRIIAPLTPWAGLDGSLGSAGVKADSDPRMWDANLTELFGIKASHGGFIAEDMVAVTGPWLVKAIKWALDAVLPKPRLGLDGLLRDAEQKPWP